jgi:hypothetical protein
MTKEGAHVVDGVITGIVEAGLNINSGNSELVELLLAEAADASDDVEVMLSIDNKVSQFLLLHVLALLLYYLQVLLWLFSTKNLSIDHHLLPHHLIVVLGVESEDLFLGGFFESGTTEEL